MLVFGTENQASAEEMAIEFMNFLSRSMGKLGIFKAKENIWAILN